MVSLTVLGELTAKCIPDRKDDFDAIVRIYCAYETKVLVPNPQLRDCCMCIQNHLVDSGIYGASATDITHFAYAVANRCDYYVTPASEVRTLAAPCGDGEAHADCEEPPSKIVTLRQLKVELLQ
jgi:hypothetical protein